MENAAREEPKRGSILLVQAVDYDTMALAGFQPLCMPLSIATIAALTPEGFDVDLWDENLHGFITEETVLPRSRYDIVGISTLFEEVGRRVSVLAAIFRARGTYLCAGGPGISNHLKEISGHVDSVFVNEAEYTWPQFLQEWSAGHPKREYVQIAKPDMADSPQPQWKSIADEVTRYRAGGVQTTRGCPFDCEFCDVIYLYGRAQRHKPVENVLAEVTTLQKLGARRVFFTDDEFIGDPRYVRALLQGLIPLNNSFPRPLLYNTQLTLNLSRHEDVLELIADANFSHALIGIESFNEASLQETNKLQNCNRDIIADCRKILSYGVGINGSLIVGFDHDGPDVFDRILDGIQGACIPFATVSILRATYGTKLWTRLRENKRLWKLRTEESIPQALRMTILPGGSLSRAQLIEGRVRLNRELSRVDHLCERLHGWISLVRRLPRVHDPEQVTFDGALKAIRDNRALGLSAAEIQLVAETLEHARDTAPIMVGRIVDAIVSQLFWYRIRTFHADEELQAVLAAEAAGDLVPDDKPIALPSAFATAFKKHLFPVVYERLFRNLRDRGQIPEAASEVFVDFLIRTLEGVPSDEETAFSDPRHDDFLRVLCDRTAARMRGDAPEEFVAAEDAEPVPLTAAKKSGLYDAVLKDVGDRICRLNG